MAAEILAVGRSPQANGNSDKLIWPRAMGD